MESIHCWMCHIGESKGDPQAVPVLGSPRQTEPSPNTPIAAFTAFSFLFPLFSPSLPQPAQHCFYCFFSPPPLSPPTSATTFSLPSLLSPPPFSFFQLLSPSLPQYSHWHYFLRLKSLRIVVVFLKLPLWGAVHPHLNKIVWIICTRPHCTGFF